MIGIIDSGIGNVGSLANMFKRIGVEARVVSTPAQLQLADKLVLPGVGAFDKGIQQLKSSGLRETLDIEVLENKKPILGICLGMQLMTNCSEEGELPGLGWIDAETVHFNIDQDASLRVPHMGWNTISLNKQSPLIAMDENQSRYYFVHSYYVVCRHQEDILATTHYSLPFVSAIEKGHIFGVQFHPEKSHRFGMQILKRFASVGTPARVLEGSKC